MHATSRRGMVSSLGLAVMLLGSTSIIGAGCVPDKEKQAEWQKPPSSWDPKGAEHLTFNKKGLEAFNTLPPKQRQKFVEELESKPGSFVGQAVYKQGTELTKAIDDYEHGTYEVYTELPEPVLYEIKLNYRLYTAPEKAKDIPPNAYVEFKGTLADLVYHDDSKPRSIDLKIKADEIKVLED